LPASALHGLLHAVVRDPGARVFTALEPRTTTRVHVPRFFLVQQNLESPIRIWLEVRAPARGALAEHELARFTRSFAVHYPDKQAFWEPLNNDLVAAVLEHFPHAEHVKSVFQVGSSNEIPMLRESHVEQSRGQRRHEAFEFLATRLQLSGRPGQVFDLSVHIDYVAGGTDYPDYRDVLDTCVASLQRDVRTASDELAPAITRLQKSLPRAFSIVARASVDLSRVATVPASRSPTLRLFR
jgi:hypothetical protein